MRKITQMLKGEKEKKDFGPNTVNPKDLEGVRDDFEEGETPYFSGNVDEIAGYLENNLPGNARAELNGEELASDREEVLDLYENWVGEEINPFSEYIVQETELTDKYGKMRIEVGDIDEAEYKEQGNSFADSTIKTRETLPDTHGRSTVRDVALDEPAYTIEIEWDRAT